VFVELYFIPCPNPSSGKKGIRRSEMEKLKVLEDIRSLEAEIESIRASIAHQLLLKMEGKVRHDRHRILQDTFIVNQISRIRTTAERLLQMYLDEDAIAEARELPSTTEEAALATLFATLGDIKERYRHHPSSHKYQYTILTPKVDLLDNLFSSAERFGASLDLNPHYGNYSKFMIRTKMRRNVWEGRVSFVAFCEGLVSLLQRDITTERKLIGFSLYSTFVEELLSYLIDFFGRWRPLDDEHLEHEINEAVHRHRDMWEQLAERRVPPSRMKKYERSFVLWDLALLTQPNEAMREAMEAPDDDAALGGALGSAYPISRPSTYEAPRLQDVEALSLAEAKIIRLLAVPLSQVYHDTAEYVKRWECRTAEDMRLDAEDADAAFKESVEKAAETVRASSLIDTVAKANLSEENLLPPSDHAREDDNVNATLSKFGNVDQLVDALGNPLERWLLKLQQRNKTFHCEVCGGRVYHGPREFRDHFQMPRHLEGLRKLGCSGLSTSIFSGIATIDTALWMRDFLMKNGSNIRKRLREEHNNAEMQDTFGNVMSVADFRKFQQGRR
jgi:splicing factor 3A subunit 3